MTTLEKLNKLYENIDRLHPLTKVMVTGFIHTKKRKLRKHDEQYIEDVFPLYFPELKEKTDEQKSGG